MEEVRNKVGGDVHASMRLVARVQPIVSIHLHEHVHRGQIPAWLRSRATR